MNNSTLMYIVYNSEKMRTPNPMLDLDFQGGGKGTSILQLVEHNQENRNPAVHIQNAEGLALAHGSTESCGGGYVYQMTNCKNVYMGQRRYYHRQKRTGWGRYAPGVTMAILGGEGNIIDQYVDIANPQTASLLNGDPALQIWSSIFEEEIIHQVPAQKRFSYGKTVQSMPELDQWAEPRLIDHETLLSFEHDGGTVDLSTGADLPSGACMPIPPVIPKSDIPPTPESQAKKAANFGAALLAAGADPTGTRPSDAAFDQVLKQYAMIEVPEGQFLLRNPLSIPTNLSGRKWIMGSGQGRTHIRYSGRGSALRFLNPSIGSLAKNTVAEAVSVTVSDLTVSGGDYGYEAPNTPMLANLVQLNVTYQDYSIAGVKFQSNSHGSTEKASPHEQNRFINCRFIGGQYGFRYDGYSDKYLIFRCSFENQSKAGILLTNISHWHSGIYQCDFKNIDGSAISIQGGNLSAGYGPWVFNVDNCTFTECGNAQSPIVTFSVSWLGVLSHSRFVTKSKPVHSGFEGVAGVIEGVEMDLNLVDGVAMYVGHQRWEKTAGLGGSRVANVNVNGKIEFLDRKSYSSKYGEIFFNPSLYADASNPFHWMFYNVRSSNHNIEYAILDDGKVLLDLSKYQRCDGAVSIGSVSKRQQKGHMPRRYDYLGRSRGETATKHSKSFLRKITP